ncbi:MAG: purine-nucleoside phosphorylase [Planctomycetales bacterium]|nr:purine-nucleoside phosphorylase [Planctomycetales bacterium]
MTRRRLHQKFLSCDVAEYDRRVRQARDWIVGQRLWQPQVALILGSGLGCLAESIEHATKIPYQEIPYFPTTHANGHAGNLILGYLAGLPVVAMQGRGHRYEGLSNPQVRFPIHCLHALGAQTLIATNAAGGLNARYRAGDLMVLDSHLDFLWARGQWAADIPAHRRAPPRTPPYDWELLARAHTVARRHNQVLHQGCYLATLGPTYETRSEYRVFRQWGADAVGMSTVPEVLAAQALGMRVLAFSVITNVASTDIPRSTTHAEVVESGGAAGPRLLAIIHDLLQDMAGQPD